MKKINSLRSTFTLGFHSYGKKIGLYLFLMVQITLIMIMGNVMVASLNGRKILYKPFEYILKGNGAGFGLEDGVTSTVYEYGKEDIEKVCELLHGKSEIHIAYDAFDLISMGEIRCEVRIHAFEEEFIKNLNLPLQSGKWSLTEKSSQYVNCVVAPNVYGIKVGDIIETEGNIIKYKVVGVLTDLTYEPSFSIWSKDVSDNFDSYEKNVENQLFIIVNQSNLQDIEEPYFNGAGVFIKFQDNLSEQELMENYSTLLAHGQVRKISKFRQNSRSYLYSDMKKILPLMAGGLIIICIGMVSAISIITQKQIKKYKIYYLCGASKARCIGIYTAGTNIMILMSLITAIAVLCVWNTFFNITVIGFRFEINNVIFTIVMLILFEILAILVPAIIFGKKSVKELLKEE